MNPLLRLIALLLAFIAARPGLAAELRDYTPVKVAAHTWVIHGPLGDPSPENQGFMNNPAFVETADGVVVVDPGSSVQAGRMLLRQIRRLTAKPVTHVVNTHVHGDHWLGNQAIREAYPQAILMAHPDMIRAAHAGEGAKWLATMEKLTAGFTRGTRAIVPTTALTENAAFAAGGLNFRIHAPADAHSKTDIMIEVVEDGVLFLGDNVMNGRFGRMDDGTFRGNVAACDRALATAATVFVPGHGATGERKIVAAYRDYLATLFETVKREYDAGRQDYEMKEAVRARLGLYTQWEGFDLHFGRHISVAVLELESM
ncbi:MAG: MBL fold metallo-hydrolase [Rhodocyclaceae bacterium]|nr:MBL fold metallo-hydrolase [Rhodocyclaceae bacterium]